MKVYKFLCLAGLVIISSLNSGCKKILEEHPQSGIVPSFFSTPDGLLGGIAAVYNDIRSAWGTEGFSLQAVAGTDEHLTGASVTSLSFFNYNGLTTGALNNSWWNTAYTEYPERGIAIWPDSGPACHYQSTIPGAG
jgi:hypothetical protein